MDAIVVLFRVLANPLRLRMHAAICRHPGIAVSQLAERLGVREVVVSQHLRALQDTQLLDCRPSGRFVHVHPPKFAASDRRLVALVSRRLTELWRETEKDNSIPSKVWNSTDATEVGEGFGSIHEALVFVFTTYTHLRRLLILRLLAQHGPLSSERLATTIGMSDPAVSRHLSKLSRRGCVQRRTVGRPAVWQVVGRPGTRFQAAVHNVVMEELTRMAADG